MGNLPIEPTPPFILYISVMIFLGIVAMGIYLQRYFTGRATLPWSGMLAPVLPLPWHYILICLLWLALNSWLLPWILPLLGILLAALIIISLGKIPSDFWQLKIQDIPRYIKISFGIFFLALIPLHAVPVISDFVLTQLNIPIEPQPAIEKLLESKNLKDIGIFILDAIILAPLWEEIVFRGFLYPLFKAKIGKKSSLILTSFLFAAVHFHLPTFFPLAFFGIILVWVYEKYGSLGYSIALHAIFNAFSACTILLLKS